MADPLARIDQVLDWVYDQAEGKSTETISILDFAKSVGIEPDEAFTIAFACRDAGLSENSSTMGLPRIRLTAAGLAHVYNMRVRRDDPALRAATCRTEMLRWFYRQHIAAVHMPVTRYFGQSDDAEHEGSRFTDIEIQNTAEYLANKGLIKGANIADIRGPVRAEITTEGTDCVTDWSGGVAQYLRDRRGYGPTNNFHGPYIQGDAPNAQMAWQNRDVVQNRNDGQQVAPGFESLAASVAELIRLLPTLGLSTQDEQDAQDVAEEIVGEIVQDQPNRGRLRRAAAALRGLLMPIAHSAVQGVGDQTREEAGKLVEHITSALN